MQFMGMRGKSNRILLNWSFGIERYLMCDTYEDSVERPEIQASVLFGLPVLSKVQGPIWIAPVLTWTGALRESPIVQFVMTVTFRQIRMV
jgi:hypothetical protein